ncbi:MAG: alpha/beta fold hydrolase [Candidatus Aenigmarchaeota archaeon]|nr:alpha/beta fold hydrolase [Candidatus Aenigmarchaeota archaeon]
MHKIQFNNSKGEKLAGILNIPPGKSKFPAIILAHGFGYHMHETNEDNVNMFDVLAKTLCENGFVTLQFDFTGCGESEGDFSKSTLTSHVSDLNSALEILRKLPFVDTKRVGIIGMSFGTAVTVARGDHNIKAITLLSSCKNPRVEIAKIVKYRGGYNPDGISILKHEDEPPVKIGPQFWKDFDNYNFPEIIKNIHVPVMLIHGEKDDLVGRKIDDYFDLANQPKELHIIKNTQHGYEGKEAMEEMLKLVLGWFKKWL